MDDDESDVAPTVVSTRVPPITKSLAQLTAKPSKTLSKPLKTLSKPSKTLVNKSHY
jgi:hypothetical protein